MSSHRSAESSRASEAAAQIPWGATRRRNATRPKLHPMTNPNGLRRLVAPDNNDCAMLLEMATPRFSFLDAATL